MQPGIYCVDTVLKLNTENVHVYGQDVTIWVRTNNGFKINGSTVELYANQDPDFEYAGYLIIVEPDYDAAVTACEFEGNAVNHYEGAIYAPHCDIKVAGTADTGEAVDNEYSREHTDCTWSAAGE